MNALPRLGDRIADFTRAPTRSRSDTRAVFKEVSRALPGTVIFGGMIRDFALGFAREFSSDIDLVSRATPSDIKRAIGSFKPTVNKFGGFRFVHGHQRFDIWSLADTWAFREGFVECDSLDSLLRTTFFNFDAIYLPLGRRMAVTHPDYASWLASGVLDINLSANPSPTRMAERALNHVLQKRLKLSTRLAQYVVQHSERASLSRPHLAVLSELELHLKRGVMSAFTFEPQASLASKRYWYF